MAELDGADGVSDGKFHGVDIADLKHDLGKSTEGWEQRPDGKWYKRDYYSASKTQAQVAVSDERDAIIATLRRELAEKDAIIADLRATISAKITIITRLESERARFLAIISQLEQQITVLQSQQQVVVQQPAPVVAMEPPGRSYYVVRSQRGADLLAHYGRNDVVVNPAAPPMVVGDWMPPMMPVMPAPAPIVVPAEYPVVAAAPAAVQVTQTEIKQEPAVSASMTQQEYYRVADEEARRRLDMMDGKLDGKLHGTDIKLQEGAAFSAGATSTTTTMVSGGAAAGGAVGLTQQEYYRVADEEARRKLDMMDGKMDGKFHGTDIQLK
eukprot:TRINITY_DN19256_c0_g1_i1.p1 TRINITY_DN19256_c0_g1~~TRINITY_DN19256_c0_g1_i1.p1  ORF type:complete len:360 (-),score=97.38 TRINITY_DN19256_c0_g1_i1:107-1084(-)